MNGLAMKVHMPTQAVIMSFASFSTPPRAEAVLLCLEWQQSSHSHFIEKE